LHNPANKQTNADENITSLARLAGVLSVSTDVLSVLWVRIDLNHAHYACRLHFTPSSTQNWRLSSVTSVVCRVVCV